MNRLVVIGLVMVFSGCATMKDGAEQTIEIDSEPAGATIKIEPSGMTAITPATVELARGIDHVVHFSLDGFEDHRARINRARNDAVFRNSYIPIVGLFGLAADAQSDAEFLLSPERLKVNLLPIGTTPARPMEMEQRPAGMVTFFNRNHRGFPVHFQLDDGETCKLKLGELYSIDMSLGPHKLIVFHWDVLKFKNEYEIQVSPDTSHIGLLTGIGSTHYSYYDDLPEMELDFTSANCDELSGQEGFGGSR